MATRVGIARSKLKETQGLQQALKALKSFTPEMLGHGSPAVAGRCTKRHAKKCSTGCPRRAPHSAHEQRMIGLGSLRPGKNERLRRE